MLNITNSPLLHPSGEVRLSPLSITTALVWRLLSFLHVLSLPENSRGISVRIQPGRLPLICLRNISKLSRMALLKSKNKKALFLVREFVTRTGHVSPYETRPFVIDWRALRLRLGAKLRVTENRCVLFDSFTYIYSALLPQYWALYAKVDSTPTFIYTYIYMW